MKNSLPLLIFTGIVSASAFAESPLITKLNHSGFTPPEYSRSEKCEVYSNRAVITRQIGVTGGHVTSTEVRNFKLQGAMKQLLQNAANATLEEKENLLCDGPHTTVSAGSTLLYATGGCGAPRKERQGAAAMQLRAIIDEFCPVTNRIGVAE